MESIFRIYNTQIRNPWDAHQYRNKLIPGIEIAGKVIAKNERGDREVYKNDSINRWLAQQIRLSTIVLWKDDLRKAATEGFQLFHGRLIDTQLIKFHPQLWIYEKDVGIRWIPGNRSYIPPQYDLASLLLTQRNGKWLAVMLCQADSDYVQNDQILREKILNNDFSDIAPLSIFLALDEHDPESHVHSQISAQLGFMNLEIASVEKSKFSRQVRRAAERKNEELPDIRTITLRRRRQESSDNKKHLEIDWSCRWLVGAHWRNQWCPKSGEHRPVYIMPYIKGPDNKPFRENNSEKLFVVAR